MVPVASLLIVVLISMIVVKVGTVALTMTGLDPEVAHLQALSAFSGVGFTTHESESVMGQPIRRKVIKFLMMAGNAGITSAVAALIVAMMQTGTGYSTLARVGLIAGGLAVLFVFARSRWLSGIVSHIIQRGLQTLTPLELKDYATLLDIEGGYSVMEVKVREGAALIGKPLRQLDLPRLGVMVIGVRRSNGKYEGVPNGATTLFAGDTAICYGSSRKMREILAPLLPEERDGED